MFPYSEERFSADEATVLRRYVTNLDQPVFALVNLPEVVKGALFARYSRSPKSLRRLFLDEFVPRPRRLRRRNLRRHGRGWPAPKSSTKGSSSSTATTRWPSSGGVHLACEQASNVLSKVLEWGRLMAYLEQSTRYIAYNQRLANGQYRYYRPPEILDSAHGARYVGEMDRVFDTYGELLPRLQAWVAEHFPQQAGDSDFVYRQATRAKSLDALRGLLPAASLSNIGIYGTGQSYEQLLLRMRAHPLPEARSYADLDARRAAQGDPVVPPDESTWPTGAGNGPPISPRPSARRRASGGPPLARHRSRFGARPGGSRRRGRRRGDALGLRPRR